MDVRGDDGVVAVLWKPVNVYAGAGYGKRTECWEDYGGYWGKVTDRSFEGINIDCGILLHFSNHLSLHAGITSTAFEFVDAEFGFGICF